MKKLYESFDFSDIKEQDRFNKDRSKKFKNELIEQSHEDALRRNERIDDEILSTKKHVDEWHDGKWDEHEKETPGEIDSKMQKAEDKRKKEEDERHRRARFLDHEYGGIHFPRPR